MRNLYFDICAIPFYLLILWTCYFRRMTKGHASRIFIRVNWISLVCVIADIAAECIVHPLPLSQQRVALGTFIVFVYFLLRNSCLGIYIMYLLAITRTDYLLRPLKNRILLWLPMGVVAVTLLQNFFTHNVYAVTAEGGYSRGPMIVILYAVAIIYGIVGMGYGFYCRRYLTGGKWAAVMSIYVLTYISIVIQLIYPKYLVEMYATSIGVTMVLLLVMRPEEKLDSGVNIQNWKTYQVDLGNALKTGQPIQILVVRIGNVQKMRSYLGEDRYNRLLGEVSLALQALYNGSLQYVNREIYLERPGMLYLTLDDASYDLQSRLSSFVENLQDRFTNSRECGTQFEVKVCLIRCPEDLSKLNDIINLGHKFHQLGRPGQSVCIAADIVSSRDYQIIDHLDEILRRAIAGNGFEMYYQPIYDLRKGRFVSAEALLRLKDQQYGMISPGVFIPYAESSGLILSIGEVVLEKVFRFIAEHDMQRLGLSQVKINLSVAQLLQSDLPQSVRRLQYKYEVDPRYVNFEITETLFDNISENMDRNVRTLRSMGYSFSLDDYGVGYSNIQRMSKLPLDIIKIDKSLVDEMFTNDGRVIIKNTIRMMKGIHKELVVEGVETKEAVDALAEMSCDYIQGFYYSRPLPEDAFIQFMTAHSDNEASQ